MSEAELTEALKSAIANCGQSLNSLAKECGVSQPQLSRFLTGERSLSLDAVEKLIAYFNFKVQVPKKPKKK